MSASGDLWIGYEAAVTRVMQHDGSSRGAARAKMKRSGQGIMARGSVSGEMMQRPFDDDLWREASLPWQDGSLGPSEVVNFEINVADLEYCLANQVPAKNPPPSRGDKGGAPRSNLKDAFLWEVIRIANLDALPDDPRELTKQMRGWCHVKWGDAEPSARTLQTWVNEIYSEMLRG
jgi:hypothetical protein